MARRPKRKRYPKQPGWGRVLTEKKPIPRDASRFWAEYLSSPEAERPEPLPGQGELFEDAGEAGRRG